MATHNISITVKEQVKKSELQQAAEVFGAIETLIQQSTFTKALCKGIIEDIHAILDDYQDADDADYISFMSPEDTADFFRNYFNSTNIVKFKSAFVTKGNVVGEYVIKKGSRIAKLTPTNSVGVATKERLQQLIDDGIIDSNGFFNADATVSSASMAATIIAGTPTGGKKIFSTILW